MTEKVKIAIQYFLPLCVDKEGVVIISESFVWHKVCLGLEVGQTNGQKVSDVSEGHFHLKAFELKHTEA